jgi:hypothetical protein
MAWARVLDGSRGAHRWMCIPHDHEASSSSTRNATTLTRTLGEELCKTCTLGRPTMRTTCRLGRSTKKTTCTLGRPTKTCVRGKMKKTPRILEELKCTEEACIRLDELVCNLPTREE